MSRVSKQAVVKIFDKLNSADFEYILLRNIQGELPERLSVGKDIDILIKEIDSDKATVFFEDNKFIKISHPHHNNVFLYATKRFEFYKNRENILFDLNYHLMCRSLDEGQWIPLDQKIQESLWGNKVFVEKNGFSYWSLCLEDELISLVVRSVFDKRKFHKGYVCRIEELYPHVNRESFRNKLDLIFFKYSISLLEQLENKQYENIVSNYFKFKEY